jgi:RNA polymerase sigma factor (sigma-70 family)
MSRRRPSEHGWLAHYGELFGTWARRFNRDPDREDALQDAAVSLLETGVTGIENLRGYMARVSYNKMVDAHRRRTVIPTTALDEVGDHELIHESGPEDGARASLLTDSLQAALSELPLKCQQVFIWNRLEGHTQEEIAHTMRLSLSTVEKYMKRALEHLYDRLQDHH